MAALDANKGQSPIYGPNSTSAPSASYPLVVNSDGSINVQGGSGAAIIVKDVRSVTGTESNVASTAAAGGATILAANANRLGGSVYNDSTQILYLLVGAGTVSSTVYSVAMAASSYFEIPFNYTGILQGIWASANGNARVMEFT